MLPSAARAVCHGIALSFGDVPGELLLEVVNGRIDVLDRGRRRVVEAKLDVGLTSVCQAVGQAEGYLYVVQRFNEATVDRVAVLLPKKPGPVVLDYLGTLVAAGRRIGLVYLKVTISLSTPST